MNPIIIQAIVRHLLTAIAGGFAVKYGVDGGTMDAIIGGACHKVTKPHRPALTVRQ